MRLLTLNNAAIEIRQALDQNSKRGLRSPFFFMVGAGISHPPLPLAAQIEQICKNEALSYGKPVPSSRLEPLHSYSYWFEQAYPHADSRQRFLRDFMETAFISRANFRLAHLLLKKSVTNLVVTANFDDFLSRALTLFGHRHVVCDHPRTLERIDLGSEDVQIMHIHGSYWFYDCCNLGVEIQERAKASSDTSFTMLGMLDDILRGQSPLVVGYSGWEGDVFMSALKRRLLSSTTLRTNLYWFCYHRKHAQQLPDWLTSHASVRIVVPEASPRIEPVVRGNERMALPVAEDTGGLIAESGDSRRDEPLLEAVAVFDVLIQSLNLDVPDLTKNPVRFFADHLRRSLLGTGAEKLENDVYAIQSVISRLEKLAEQEKQLPVMPKEALLETFRNLLRQSKFVEGIKIAEEIPILDLDDDQLRELIVAVNNAAATLDDSSADELDAYALVVRIADRIKTLGRDDDSSNAQSAKALLNKGRILGRLNKSDEAIAVYEELVRRFGDAPEPELREQVVKALNNKGVTLGTLNRSDEAIAAYEDAARRFGDAAEFGLLEVVAKALNNKGVALGTLNKSAEAIAVYEEVARRFGDAPEPGLREQVARALLNKGVTLGTLKKSDEAIAVYEELIRRFGDAAEPALRELVAETMFNKGFTFGTLNKSDEAIAVYEELVRRFGEAPEPGLREQVAKALEQKRKLEALKSGASDSRANAAQ